MKIIEPSYEILTPIDKNSILKIIELAGRVCYKSEDKIKEGSDLTYADMICNVKKHHSVIEHASVSVKFICNRGFSHEMVRHRLASFSQESTRYVNYSKDKQDNQITVINPCWFDETERRTDDILLTKYEIWYEAMRNAENSYLALIKAGAKPEEARGVLPIDVKTEIVVTANLREWIHIFNMRTSKFAHPSMRQLMRPLLEEFKQKIPVIFDNVEVDDGKSK